MNDLEQMHTLGVLSEQVRHLQEQVQRLSDELRILNDQANRAKGAFWLMLGLGAGLGWVVDKTFDRFIS